MPPELLYFHWQRQMVYRILSIGHSVSFTRVLRASETFPAGEEERRPTGAKTGKVKKKKKVNLAGGILRSGDLGSLNIADLT